MQKVVAILLGLAQTQGLKVSQQELSQGEKPPPFEQAVDDLTEDIENHAPGFESEELDKFNEVFENDFSFLKKKNHRTKEEQELYDWLVDLYNENGVDGHVTIDFQDVYAWEFALAMEAAIDTGIKHVELKLYVDEDHPKEDDIFVGDYDQDWSQYIQEGLEAGIYDDLYLTFDEESLSDTTAQDVLVNTIYGGGWTRVRHVPQGGIWHKSSDKLTGIDIYGDQNKDEDAWSIKFEDAVPQYNEMMFASGDMSKWIVMDKMQAYDSGSWQNGGGNDGTYYERNVLQSSINENPYIVTMRNGKGTMSPWISLESYGDNNYGTEDDSFVYAGYNRKDGSMDNVVHAHGGADVYVRKSQ